MGRVLAIDYGDQRIGLALSDPLKIIASPYKTIVNNDIDYSVEVIQKIVIDDDIELTIIGLPLSMSGKDTDQTKKVKLFSNKLSSKDIKIKFVDERWSSKAAKRSMQYQGIKTGHNKSLVDRTAAAIFLQQYLDQK
ncbi:MAG: Holliday junction resolvase RuvX [Candidatus Neomarinimicrobiota bacterium]|tara:strand:+ start:668 stop:1075 length:408 start_codon:yes stop_codon:yes gene_type:complete